MKKIITFTLILICVATTPTLAKNSTSNSSADKMTYMNMPFWKHFNDDTLIENLTKVYNDNHDLKATASKVEEVKRLVKISFSNELPHIGFNGYVGYTFASSDEVFGNIVIPNYNEARFLLPLSFSYEVDIWGKNHLKTKSRKKSYEMIQQDERSVYIALSSIFAQTYFNLIKADKLIDYQKEMIAVQKQVVDAVKKKNELGTADIENLIAEEKCLTYMEEELQNLQEKQDVLQNQLSVMIADRAFSKINRSSYDKLNAKVVIPEKIDFGILDKRPDRIRAELNLQKIGYDVKVARREFLPTFTITGNLGFNFYNISSTHNFLANLGVAPNWDLFDGGRKVAILKLQKAKYEGAFQDYETSILKSIQETNDSLYNLKSIHSKTNISQKRTTCDIVEYKLTQVREEIGTADKLDLLMRKKLLINSKKQEAALKMNELIASIQLYQALGGVDYFTEEL